MNTILALVLIVCLVSVLSGKSIFVQCKNLDNDKKHCLRYRYKRLHHGAYFYKFNLKRDKPIKKI